MHREVQFFTVFGVTRYPLRAPDIPIFHAIESRRVLHFDYRHPLSYTSEEDRRVHVRVYIPTYVYGHAGISICRQGSILSSVALCKDSNLERAKNLRS